MGEGVVLEEGGRHWAMVWSLTCWLQEVLLSTPSVFFKIVAASAFPPLTFQACIMKTDPQHIHSSLMKQMVAWKWKEQCLWLAGFQVWLPQWEDVKFIRIGSNQNGVWNITMSLFLLCRERPNSAPDENLKLCHISAFLSCTALLWSSLKVRLLIGQLVSCKFFLMFAITRNQGSKFIGSYTKFYICRVCLAQICIR